MSVTFSLFGYFISFQLFKNLFVPIERLDGPSNATRLDERVETDYLNGSTQESKSVTS